jgi:hypothetical protein
VEVCNQTSVEEPRYDPSSFTGTAGCVLASRLSDDPNLRVLLLEAGERCIYYLYLVQLRVTGVFSPVNDPYVRIPSAYTFIMKTSKVLNLFTTPQPNSGGRRHYWPRGKHRLVLWRPMSHFRIPQQKCLVVVGLIIGVDRLFLSTLFRFLYQCTGVSACNVELSFC